MSAFLVQSSDEIQSRRGSRGDVMVLLVDGQICCIFPICSIMHLR